MRRLAAIAVAATSSVGVAACGEDLNRTALSRFAAAYGQRLTVGRKRGVVRINDAGLQGCRIQSALRREDSSMSIEISTVIGGDHQRDDRWELLLRLRRIIRRETVI